jgi:hypothetical protein
VKSWRDWFIPPDGVVGHAQNELADVESGSRHKDYDTLQLKRKQAPRCATCKRWMGHDDGMYILLDAEWRIHMHCFSKVVEQHYEDGEVIDLTTGNIMQREVED